jgi:hypothetical protein
VPTVSDHATKPWFFGGITRNGTEQRLYGTPDGTFLVRASESSTNEACVTHSLHSVTLFNLPSSLSQPLYLTLFTQSTSLPYSLHSVNLFTLLSSLSQPLYLTLFTQSTSLPYSLHSVTLFTLFSSLYSLHPALVTVLPPSRVPLSRLFTHFTLATLFPRVTSLSSLTSLHFNSLSYFHYLP